MSGREYKLINHSHKYRRPGSNIQTRPHLRCDLIALELVSRDLERQLRALRKLPTDEGPGYNRVALADLRSGSVNEMGN